MPRLTVILGWVLRVVFASSSMVARPMGVCGWVSDWARWQLAQAAAEAPGGACAITGRLATATQSSAGNTLRTRRGTGHTFRHFNAQQALTRSIVFASGLGVSLDQREMNFEVVGIEFQCGLQMGHPLVYVSGFYQRTSEYELGAGRIRGFGGRLLCVGQGTRSVVA